MAVRAQPVVAIIQLGCAGLAEAQNVVEGITDAVALSGGAWLVSAVAEATDDSYHDGACAGAALAVISSAGELKCWWPLAELIKVEGICLHGTNRDLLLVNAFGRCGDPGGFVCRSLEVCSPLIEQVRVRRLELRRPVTSSAGTATSRSLIRRNTIWVLAQHLKTRRPAELGEREDALQSGPSRLSPMIIAATLAALADPSTLEGFLPPDGEAS